MLADISKYMLKLDGLVSGYGARQILNQVSVEIGPREIVALIGHNGSGKSTFLKTVFGLIRPWKGRVFLDDKDVGIPCPQAMVRLGVAYVPQGNRVFGDLTVYENLQMGDTASGDRSALKDKIRTALELFPDLKPLVNRKAQSLSGGEKQLLALATGLILSPRMLLLDEPTLGLAPLAARRALKHIQELRGLFGMSILIVEQKVRAVLEISERVYVMREGRISFSGPSAILRDETSIREQYL
jgi:branched-chain amino acid transport system ATP-binding protein